ncbi:alcohol dehydrogenase catalytic domain-containing protein [Actinomycetospora cinnamomea]|uniref:Propanol-preferring alcohol dehydrogenase n=1 Tax=Actinomycetospora cinnamomea TaxID=663609 RepID=A0A2U1FAA7_9PSEU|nr:alcohol dehydrogenase catalytic domain-containing protein [Actinomycetospora cinnamomea]PVZ09123.1 propanol-preferring alcohol dehydrogenase [Actinomycetospora cinnamomea]
MRAARFHAPHQPMVLEEVPTPEPGPDEVRVKVAAAGVCGTELHFVEGLYAPASLPTTLGHEAVGTVDAVGAEVADRSPGDRVVVDYYLFCGACRWCLAGRQNLCLRPRGVLAFAADGAFAEYLVVPARCLVTLPDDIPFESAAPLCCAGATSVHALNEADVAHGELVVVLGAGGVGLAAVAEAHRRGATVVAVSRREARRRAATVAGAAAVVDLAGLPTAVARLSGGQGADVVLEMAGVEATMRVATEVLGRRGRLVFVGYSADTLTVSPLAMVVPEQRILTSVGNTLPELAATVALAQAGQLPPVDDVLPLAEVNVALDRLRSGKPVGRLVLAP